jgi:hypothetical protein
MRFGLREVAMLRTRKEAKSKKRILETLLRDMHGTPADERLKAAIGQDRVP